jgi:hypothetical protein
MSKFGYSAYFNDLVRVGRKNKSITQRALIPPQENRMLHMPLTVDLQPHSDFASYNSFISPVAAVLTLKNGTIYPKTRIVQTKEGYVIPELIDGLPRAELKSGWRPWVNRDKTKRIVKLKTVAAALISPRNYYSWMGGMISKFYLLMKSGYWRGIDYFLVEDCLYNYQLETFGVFGIANKILTVKKLKGVEAISAEKIVIAPTHVLLAKWGCFALRKGFFLFRLSLEEQGVWRTYKRLYLSREDANCRQVKNEPEVVSFLTRYGFKKVVLGSLDVATQAHLFKNAEVIVGPHGSGFTNIACCKKGTKIVEFFSSEYAHSTFWEMSNYLGLSYGYITDDGCLTTTSREKRYGEKDMVVNINRLEKILSIMHVGKGRGWEGHA